MSSRSLRPLLSVALLLGAGSLWLGCAGCPAPAAFDAGTEPPPQPAPSIPDAGGPPAFDAGVVEDAGITYSKSWAAEACPEESYATPDDAGAPDGSRTFGLCIALRSLTGHAEHNGQRVTAPIHLDFTAGNYQGEIDRTPDGTGQYQVRVMRARYDQLRYHPSTIFPTHAGPVDFGVIDLTQDRSRDLTVRSWTVRGSVSFGGVPWKPTVYPQDVQLGAAGIPSQQGVAATSAFGGYEAALIEGQFAVGVAVPREALGDTEISGLPVIPAMSLTSDSTIDVHLPVSELSGELTIDGQAFPDRRKGEDYLLRYLLPGAQEPSVTTFHEGGVPEFRALVPKGKYAVQLELVQSRDRTWPSVLRNKQLASGLDLSGDVRTGFALTTRLIEGAILVDGVPLPSMPNAAAVLWAYGFGSATEPTFLATYEIPLDRSSFMIRAFPATYYVGLYLSDLFAPDLVSGWLIVDDALNVQQDQTLPIDVLTSVLEGRILIDGQPNTTGQIVGTLLLTGKAGARQGYFSKKIATRPDGSFRLRVPRGTYDLAFEIDPETYPGYATGSQRMLPNVNLETPRQVEMDYRTVPFYGPLRVGGEVVPDTHYAQPEVGLILRRAQDGESFTWKFEGGSPNYLLRIPKGDYALTFKIEREALPGVAWGTAPMGIKLSAP